MLPAEAKYVSYKTHALESELVLNPSPGHLLDLGAWKAT